MATRFPAHVRIIILACAYLAVVLPVNFVEVSPVVDMLALVAVALGGLAGAIVALTQKSASLATVLVITAVALAPSLIWTGHWRAGADLIGALLLGIALSVVLRSPRTFLRTIFWLLAITMLIDFVAGAPVVATTWGELLTPYYLGEGTFRARGFVGQPLPAGVVAIVLAAILFTWPPERRRGAERRLIGFTVVILVLLSGTRSALIILGLVAVLGVVAYARRQRTVPPVAVIATLWGALVLIASAAWLREGFLVFRVFDYSSLSGSASATNRLRSLEVLEKIGSTCDMICLLTGSGARSLQETLSGSGFGFTYTTTDNMFVTLLWDTGVIGLGAFIALLAVAIRIYFGDNIPRARAAAIGVIALGLSGLFFDVLYVRITAILFGLSIGLLFAPVRERAPICPTEGSRNDWKGKEANARASIR